MPDSVEMPAPVRTTTCSASRSQPATSSSGNSSVSIAPTIWHPARRGNWWGRPGAVPGRPHPTRAGSGGGGWEQTGFPRGFAVAIPRPAGGVVADRGVEPTGEQGVLDVVVTVALLEQREREAPGAPAGGGDGRLVEAGLGPVGVV